ncbi:AraC family transcriptional regulator [Petralouisia muris]|uniref:AraC family transcriptional regulator n=1 Tax=Petralouisia muris TaxID=3032872 RepID=A0AC61RQ73_9FIRM|nr:AraC family transcriptional regulator [Petralouisia muris]TGY90963.1 AraC family transcriptional regulator [Petralouisia muris]
MSQELSREYTYDIAFLQIVSDISGLPCAFWSQSVFWSSGRENMHPLYKDHNLRIQMETSCRKDLPVFFLENEFVLWGLMKLGRFTIAVGPSLLNNSMPGYDAVYAVSHVLQSPLSLKKVTLKEMGNYLSLLFCHFLSGSVALENLSLFGSGSEQFIWETEEEVSSYHLEQSENDRTHRHGVAFEMAIADAVRNGDVKLVKKLLSEDPPDMADIGIVAEEERKQLEYMTVALLTILTRAAKEGGLPSEKAHEVGDVYLKRLAKASSLGQPISSINLRAIIEFTESVRKAKKERSDISHVEACKAYIEENLMKNLEVGQIAPALNLSRTYLAHLFKKEEGITIQQYIQREKCRHAVRLLKYSDYPVALISEYLGFSSPGYFGNCFQQWYGVTPSKYRKENSHGFSTKDTPL